MTSAQCQMYRQISYNLYIAFILHQRHTEQILRDELNLSFSFFMILMAVDRDSVHCQKHIATFLQLTPAAISRQVNLLVKDKLIKRRVNAKNRREYSLELTDTGKQNLDKAYQALDRHRAKMLNDIACTDLDQLNNFLINLIAHLGPNDNPLLQFQQEGLN